MFVALRLSSLAVTGFTLMCKSRLPRFKEGVTSTKRVDAAKLLQGQYFNVDGESAFIRGFESRRGSMQCFRCLNLVRKAFLCTKVQICSGCAQLSHRQSDCQPNEARCAVCGGPTNRLAASVVLSTQSMMFETMQFLQLNMQKQRDVQHSVMKDPRLKEYAALVISNPYIL
jgi:hypothetical protein